MMNLVNLHCDRPGIYSISGARQIGKTTFYVQSAILENKLLAGPKKAKKLLFTDPFIYHSMKNWLEPKKDPFEEHIIPILSDPVRVSGLYAGQVNGVKTVPLPLALLDLKG